MLIPGITCSLLDTHIIICGSKLQEKMFQIEYKHLIESVSRTMYFSNPSKLTSNVPMYMPLHVTVHLYGTYWFDSNALRIIDSMKSRGHTIVDHYRLPYQIFVPAPEILDDYRSRLDSRSSW